MPIRKARTAGSTRHSESVFRLLKLVEELVVELESGLSILLPDETQKKRWSHIFGEKENVTSVLVKLAGVLVKIIPMEHELMTIINKSEEKKVKDLSEEDMEIIKRYLQKIKDTQDVENKQSDDNKIFSAQ